MAEVRGISRWPEIKAGLIVNRSEAGDNLAGRKRGQDVISSVLYHRGSSLDEKKKNPKKRERNSIWPILDILIQLSGNVTCDFSAIRYLTAVDIRCLTSSPGKRCILLTPYSAVLRREHLRLLFSILVSFPRSRNDRQLTKLSSYQIDSVTRRER